MFRSKKILEVPLHVKIKSIKIVKEKDHFD